MLNYLYFPLVPLTICTILCRTLTKQTSPFKLSSIEIRESHRRICIMKIIYCRAGDPICFFWLSDPVEALFLSRYLERKKFDWQYNPNQLFGVAVCVQELGSDPIPFRKKHLYVRFSTLAILWKLVVLAHRNVPSSISALATCTVCPRSSDPFYIVSYYDKMGHYFLDRR